MQPKARDVRHQRIVLELHGGSAVTVAQLSSVLGVSEITVRRDLEHLEARGVLKRFHGGAKLIAGSAYEPPISVRLQTDAAEKQRIAAVVSTLIKDGDTVVLDGGSTGIAVAKELMDRPITVCPLSMQVAWQLSTSMTTVVLLPPGMVRKVEMTLFGAETVEYIAAHHFDHYVMTASGFSTQHGFTAWNIDDAAVKRSAYESSAHTIAAAGGAKFGASYFATICPLEGPDVVVTSALAEGPLAQLRGQAQSLMVA